MPKIQIITSEDGSSTAYHNDYQQNYHNIHGAWLETVQLYKPGLDYLINSIFGSSDDNPVKVINIVDLGFGLGYNHLLILYYFTNVITPEKLLNKKLSINILSFENDLVEWQKWNNLIFPEEIRPFLNILRPLWEKGQYQLTFENIKIAAELKLCDARISLAKLPNKSISLWFWDAFSPNANPELWTRDLFFLAKSKSKKNASVITYSAANHIRSGLVKAGWHVTKIPGIGKKSEATWARPYNFDESNFYNFFSKILLKAIPFNIKELAIKDQVAFRDVTFHSSRDMIREKRLKIRQRIKKIF